MLSSKHMLTDGDNDSKVGARDGVDISDEETSQI